MPKVVIFNHAGDSSELQIVEQTVPAPQSDEIQIRVHAIGLNRAEIMFRRDQYVMKPEFPSKNGYEASGIIEQLGSNAPSDFKVGDSVSVFADFRLGHWGTYGELINIPTRCIMKNPANTTHVQNAALWTQYATAYGGIVTYANVQPGQHVVIRAASSSVGIAAIQVVNSIGAIPIALTRGRDKVQQLIDLGAKHVIATDEQNFEEEIRNILAENNGDLHLVFDPVGGPEVKIFLELLSYGGFFLQYGALDHSDLSLPVFPLLGKAITVIGYLMVEAAKRPNFHHDMTKFVIEGVESGKLQIVIDPSSFSLDEIAQAHDYMESNQHIGKIVVRVHQPHQ